MLQEASKALATMPDISLLPLSVAILTSLFITYWIFIALFIYSNGTATIYLQNTYFSLQSYSQAIFWIHIFSLLWVVQFLKAFSTMAIAGAVGGWYWTRKKRILNLRKFYVFHSVKRAIIYHLGTVAFGSLIVAIIEFIRLLFEKLYKELKKAHLENRIVKVISWAVRIGLQIFEWIVKYINRHAYIQTALYGTHFIKSATNAFHIITRNIIQIGILHVITQILLFIGKIVVAFAVALIGYGLSKSGWLLTTQRDIPVTSNLLIAIICFIIAFTIASLYINVMDISVDCILQCFLIDDEMCENDPNRKPYCTGSLKVFILENKLRRKVEELICGCCCCITGCANVIPGGADPANKIRGN